MRKNFSLPVVAVLLSVALAVLSINDRSLRLVAALPVSGQLLRSSHTGSSVRRTGSNEWRVVVSATEQWFDTGIEAASGAVLMMSASGVVTWAPPGGRNMLSTVGPNGTRPPFPQDSPRFPVPDAGCGSLVMRISSSTFAVGEARTIEVENAGTVQLMVNDDILSDNSGSFEVHIKLIAPPQLTSQTLILPLPEGTYRSAQGFKGTAYDPNLFHLGKDYCVDASADKTGTKLTGTRFYAIGRGTVVDVRFSEPAHRSDGVGNYITIDHGNRLIALYMHLARVFVKPGQGVDSSTPLGEAGDVILHPRPNCGHLHLEIRSDGVTSLNVPPNLRYSYASRDGKTRFSRSLGDERAVNSWIDGNFLDPERVLRARGQSKGLIKILEGYVYFDGFVNWLEGPIYKFKVRQVDQNHSLDSYSHYVVKISKSHLEDVLGSRITDAEIKQAADLYRINAFFAHKRVRVFVKSLNPTPEEWDHDLYTGETDGIVILH